MADFQLRTGPAAVTSIVTQSDSDSVGCRIVVDGVVRRQVQDADTVRGGWWTGV